MISNLINYIFTLSKSLLSTFSILYEQNPILNISSFSIIKRYKSTKPSISSTTTNTNYLNSEELLSGCRLGLDSHADISCAGKHARITETYFGQTCNVSPFNDSTPKEDDGVGGLGRGVGGGWVENEEKQN